MTENSQQFGLLLIGDELLNGSRQDKHMTQVIALLKDRGLQLAWVKIIGDDESTITNTLQQSFAGNDIIFSFGGIGATPDDITRQCAANAFKRPLCRHTEAQSLIEQQFGEEAYPNRILMSDLPQNATLIPNPVNRIPGFSINHHHFVPGFPNMAWPMIEWVLENHYRHLFQTQAQSEWRWDILNTPESSLLDMMNELLERNPDIKLSSLPNTERRGKLIDFGIKGQESAIETAAQWFESWLNDHNIEFRFREKSS